MAALDQIKFIAYILLIGFVYALLTTIYDVFSGMTNTAVTTSLQTQLTVDAMANLKFFINVYPIFNLILLGVMAIKSSVARNEKMSPYFGVNPNGIITSGAGIIMAIVLSYFAVLFTIFFVPIVTTFAVVPGSYWDMSRFIAGGFNLINWAGTIAVILGYGYSLFNSISIDSTEQVV